MFQLNKISQLVTVSPEITAGDYERRLNNEGFTGGYLPIDGAEVSLARCLSCRIPNLYFLKYGGIGDLCAGGRIHKSSGRNFHTKVYPRAATGPDLRRVVLGSQGLLGQFSEVSMRLFPFPEKMVWGVALVETLEEASSFFVRMTGHLIQPLFVKILKGDPADELMNALKIARPLKIPVVFKLADLAKVVEAQKETIGQFVEGEGLLRREGPLRTNDFGARLYWPSVREEEDLLDQTVLNADSYRLMAHDYRQFFGDSLPQKSLKVEAELKNFLQRHPC